MKAFTHIALLVALAVAVASASPAQAESSTYVRTTSGKVRCMVSANGEGTGGQAPAVICEASGPMNPPFDQWDNVGFLQAPMNGYGSHFHGAVIDSAGNFSFQDGANIGAGYPERDLILGYGQTYHLNGWTIQAGSDGTRFSNDATGHGMFVSIENVTSF